MTFLALVLNRPIVLIYGTSPSSTERHHFRRACRPVSNRLGRLVDPDIGRLGRQHHGDQQGIGVDVIQLGFGLGTHGGESAKMTSASAGVSRRIFGWRFAEPVPLPEAFPEICLSPSPPVGAPKADRRHFCAWLRPTVCEGGKSGPWPIPSGDEPGASLLKTLHMPPAADLT